MLKVMDEQYCIVQLIVLQQCSNGTIFREGFSWLFQHKPKNVSTGGFKELSGINEISFIRNVATERKTYTREI